MIRSHFRTAILVKRAGDTNVPREIGPDDLKPGDHFQISDVPVYEVDIKTQKTTDKLMIFKVDQR